MQLSARGRASIFPLPDYLRVSFAAFNDQYSAANPRGYISLSVAENRLSLPLVCNALHNVPPIPTTYLTYDWMHGSAPFRDAIAQLFEKHITKRPVDPNHISAMSGAGSTIDFLATALCDPGDLVLCTGPGYNGFERDLIGRAGARICVASLDDDHCAPWPEMSVQALQNAWDNEKDRDKIRAVMVCSPGNPTGEVLSPRMIADIVAWGRQKRLHLIFDEVYALSVHDESQQFVSVAEVLDGDLGDDVHIVWSFSKDFCVSGLRLGVLYTQFEQLNEALVPMLTYFMSTSRESQWSMQHLLTDESWLTSYMAENKQRLHDAYLLFTRRLDDMHVPYMPASAGFFVWIDLSKWLEEDSEEHEMKLWYKLVDVRVLLSPASQCFGKRFGYFRACFAAVAIEQLQIACDRMEQLLGSVH